MSEFLSRASKRRILVLGLVLVFLASVVGVVLVVALTGVEAASLWDDVTKTLLQVGLVSAGGALLSWFLYEYQQEQRRQEAREKWLRDLLARATVAYNDVKNARRLLRGRAISLAEDDQEVVHLDDYDDQIAAISNAQLQFETLRDELEDPRAIPLNNAGSLRKQFRVIEESLQRLVREYQRERVHFSGPPRETLLLEQLPQLREFRESIGGKERDPVEGFAPVHSGFHEAQDLIWSELFSAPPPAQTSQPGRTPPAR